jgi:hypothetical protein
MIFNLPQRRNGRKPFMIFDSACGGETAALG